MCIFCNSISRAQPSFGCTLTLPAPPTAMQLYYKCRHHYQTRHNRPAHTWFLKIDFVWIGGMYDLCMCVYVCMCVLGMKQYYNTSIYCNNYYYNTIQYGLKEISMYCTLQYIVTYCNILQCLLS